MRSMELSADHRPPTSDAADLLNRYVRDHWALAGAGAALARRAQRSNRNTPWGHQLERVARDIEDDDDTLDAIRHALGADGGRIRRLAVVGAERLGRLKLNGRLLSYSPLSRVYEAEGMAAGITAKRHLWLALAEAVGPTCAGADLNTLVERADDQLATVASFHRWAVVQAFQPAGPEPASSTRR
ncbi:MAG: hypothetical protein R2761_26705 [Acidimicrobiales bacterium]